MNYPLLRMWKKILKEKEERDSMEEAMLKELESLSLIIDRDDFSLAVSSGKCPACGRILEK